MKKIKTVSFVVGIFVIIGILAVSGISASKAANGPPGNQEGISQGPASGVPGGQAGGPQMELASSYVIDFLSPANAPDKTIYIKNPKGENISATWECEALGFQKLTNVSFDGEVLTFNAYSGTPGDEYFYFHLDFYGDYLLGYAKTQEMTKSPIVATADK